MSLKQAIELQHWNKSIWAVMHTHRSKNGLFYFCVTQAIILVSRRMWQVCLRILLHRKFPRQAVSYIFVIIWNYWARISEYEFQLSVICYIQMYKWLNGTFNFCAFWKRTYVPTLRLSFSLCNLKTISFKI